MSYKELFPVFQQYPDMAYLDTAATAQKPVSVINAIKGAYEGVSSNVHRGVANCSFGVTQQYEEARATVATFINAPSKDNIIFTSGCTQALNGLAVSLGDMVKPGDEIVVTALEHHSNFAPWVSLAKQKSANVRCIGLLPDGQLDIASFHKSLTDKTSIVACTHMSNVLGHVSPIAVMRGVLKDVLPNVPMVVDGCQAVCHAPVDVQDLDVDFYAFSGHKMYGPTGVGVLYVSEPWLHKLRPWKFGGGMIEDIGANHLDYVPAPHKFEAGTPPIVQAIGMAEAVRFMTQQVTMDKLMAWERHLSALAVSELAKVDCIEVHGRGPVMSLILPVHPHDVGTILDQVESVVVRVGHHCCKPLMHHMGWQATVRVSFGIYNSEQDIEKLIKGLRKALDMLQIKERRRG